MARTRDPAVDDRIHRATLALLQRDGYARTTVDAVADRAGVGKAAIYRRYRSKDDLIAGTVAALLPMGEPPIDLRGPAALAALVEDLRVALVESGGLRLLATLLVEAERHGELLTLWRQRVVAPRVAIIRGVLAEAAGTPRTDTTGVLRADPQLIGELALGGLVARHIARGDVPPAASDELAAQLWRLATQGTPDST